MRTDLTFEMPPGPDRLLDLLHRRVAHRLPRVEAVAQAQEGDVAVAVVGRLRQHRQHQLADRVAVGLHHGDPVHRAQALAHRAHAAGSGSAPGGRHAAKYRPRADGPGHRAPRHAARPAPVLAQRRRRRAARALPARRADELRRLGAASSSARAGWPPTCPGFGRSGKRGDGDFTMPGYDRFVEAFLDHAEVERVRLVVHDWGAVGPAVGPAPPRARRAPGRDQRRPAAARLSLAPRRPRSGACGASARSAIGLVDAVGLAAAAPAARWPTSPWPHFDQGTQRAILQLYRASPEDALARAPASTSARIDCPALVVWGDRDSYIPARSPTPTPPRSAATPTSCTSPTPGTGPGSTGRMSSIASPRSWTPRASRRGRWPAAAGGRLPRAGPAERGPRRAGVPRRTSASCCGTTAGTAAITCPATACSSRRWRALLGPRARRRAERGGRRVALRAPVRDLDGARALARAVVRRGDRHEPRHRPADLRARRRASAWRPCSPPRAAATAGPCVAGRARPASPARWPAPFVALAGRGVVAGRARAGGRWRWRRAPWRRRRAGHRLPRGRQLPVRRLELLAGAGASLARRPRRARATRALLRIGVALYAAGDASRASCSPRRWAATSCASARSSRAGRSRALLWRTQPPRARPARAAAPLLAVGRAGRRLGARRRRPVRARALLRRAARLPRRAARRPVPRRDPVHRQPLGVALGGAARAARARLGAPGRPRAQRALL